MMKKRTITHLITALFLILPLSVFTQTGGLILTFSGINNGSLVLLDSVYVKNITRSCDTTIYPPDLILVLDTLTTNILVNEMVENGFSVSQNFPNPVVDKTAIRITITVKDKIDARVWNCMGQQLAFLNFQPEAGRNTLLFYPGNERLYFLAITYRGITKTIRMVAIGGNRSYKDCRLEYVGGSGIAEYKSVLSGNYFKFLPGDKLLFAGYAQPGESGILDSPDENQNYEFEFATNIPCPGLDSIYYEGKYYHTIQIFNQCWLKENLNAGIMIQSTQAQTNNSTIEKYCMGNEESYCDLLGGLYFWNEMMQYTSETGGQGICPAGWHIPDDLDWQILEGAVDNEYNIGDTEWGNYGWRGADAGGNLKQTGTSLWEPPNSGSTDAFGFSALPGGYFVQGGFWGPGYKAYFWSSENGYKFYRNMDWDQVMVNKNTGGNSLAISVRCVKD